MKNATPLFYTLIFILSLVVHVSIAVGADTSQDNNQLQQGCLPNGDVFNLFYPDAISLRHVAFLTEFGTLNTNVVIGDTPDGSVAIAAMDLVERVGEYLQTINTTSSAGIGLTASTIPPKYLAERTIVLCGTVQSNALIRQLVDAGKSKVDWSAEALGKIEVVPNAFDGPGSAVILGGRDAQASILAIAALNEFFKHLTGATLVEAMMLQADKQLQHGEVRAAKDTYKRLVDGLRIDGSATFFAPIKDMSPHFPKLLKEEVDMSVEMAKFLTTEPSATEANKALRDVAKKCAFCHQRYLSYDRMKTNRISYLYSQYPDARLETEWAKSK